MKKQPQKPLPIGTPVRAMRINREFVDAEILSGPVPTLLPFGEFYILGRPGGPAPYYSGRGRKSQERRAREAQKASRIGMYNRRELIVRGKAAAKAERMKGE